MSSPIEVFDYCQTIGISLLLIITIPTASYVYSKLLFSPKFLESYTFKLIVFNGTAELLNIVMYLFVFQLASFSFMRDFYLYVQKHNLATPLAATNTLFGALALHSSLFVALNRAKTMLFFHRSDSDCPFFIISITLTMLLTLPSLLNYIFTTTEYIEIEIGGESILIPNACVTNDIFRTIQIYINAIVSLLTFLVNILLCILISRERKFISNSERQKFKVEKALVLTSVASYATYMVYFQIAEHLHVLFCGYAQWLFQGIKSMTPFWCLIVFTPSVRRLLYNGERTKTITTVQANTFTA